MPPTEQLSSNPTPGPSKANNPEQLRAKLSALLDDVTQNQEPRATDRKPEPPFQMATNHTASAAEANHLHVPRSSLSEVAQITAQIKSMQIASERAGNEPVKPPTPPALPTNAVSIKGRNDGVSIEVGKGAWNELVEHLQERLTQSPSFFRGGNATLDVGARPLLEAELAQVRKVIEEAGMKLALVRTGAERTFEAAMALGLAVKLSSADGMSDAQIEAAQSNAPEDHYFVYRGNLRSGQVLERPEHILVVGDVNPGAAVVSDGDILVWGRIRGIAHAGAGGERRSIVLALQMEPVQLRIAELVAMPANPSGRPASRPNWRATDKRAAVAYVGNDQIIVEPWDESKPGGLAAFRR
jgi:septum site-determining protein MinC